MKQEKVPALLDVEARIAAKDGYIETKPHGHGSLVGKCAVGCAQGVFGYVVGGKQVRLRRGVLKGVYCLFLQVLSSRWGHEVSVLCGFAKGLSNNMIC